MLKAAYRAVHLVLHSLRQAGRKPLQVHFLSILTAGLDKDGMALLLLKAHDLILDGRAVARANALNIPAVERRAVEIVENDLVGLGVGVGNVAVDLVVHRHAGHKAERLQLAVRVAGLTLKLVKVDAAAVDAGRCAGLEPAQRKAVRDQVAGQRRSGMGAVGAAVIVGIAHKNAAAQIGAGRNHDRPAGIVGVQVGVNAADLPVLHINADDLSLMDIKVGGLFQRVLHPDMVSLAVSLYPQAVYGRAFAAVEHPALQVGRIGGKAHQAAQCIDLAHKMPLGRAADGRVAGHIADEIQRQREHRRPCPQPCRRVGSLYSRMPRPDHDDIVGSQFVHILSFLPYLLQNILADSCEICIQFIVAIAQHAAANALQIRRAMCVILSSLWFGMLCSIQFYYQFTRWKIKINYKIANHFLTVDRLREIFQKVIPKMPFLPGHFFAEFLCISAQRICRFDALHKYDLHVLKASPSGEAAARRRLMRGNFNSIVPLPSYRRKLAPHPACGHLPPEGEGSPQKASPSGEAAARRRLMRAEFARSHF